MVGFLLFSPPSLFDFGSIRPSLLQFNLSNPKKKLVSFKLIVLLSALVCLSFHSRESNKREIKRKQKGGRGGEGREEERGRVGEVEGRRRRRGNERYDEGRGEEKGREERRGVVGGRGGEGGRRRRISI
jgi:hypothetical protein